MNTSAYDTITTLLQRDFNVPAETIRPDVTLANLGLDSLALMEFVFAVEDAFQLRIPEERLDPREAGLTLQGLADIVQEESNRPASDTKALST